MENKKVGDNKSIYYNCVKDWMLDYITSKNNTILDLGCATGRLGELLLKNGSAKIVDGVEIYEPAALAAAKIYRLVRTGDIESMDIPYKEEFDYVICGDILEHLKNPDIVVTQIHKWLKPGGCLLVCLPNIRNYRILYKLVFGGDWKYVSKGIMDNTHLRFFTRKSTARMLTDSGFEVYHQHMVIEGKKKNLFNKITFKLFREFLAAQTFVCGRKP
jgi:2-polyprenyl-3-methyl-5-hydroxy-6-metoxy-1,4-benzoquinol methylase